MARQPTLTVNVNSQQFQQFAAQFNALSGQIRQLNSQFTQISASINRSNVAMRALQSTMTGVLNISKSIGSEIWKTTKHLVSWSTIIGGITALLGGGGALYGIERLANSIMQKRRMAMGLGQDYGRTQASAVFNQSLMGSPLGAQQNIALGMHGSYDQFKSLINLGVNPTQDKRSPEELEAYIVRQLPRIMNQGGPGKELMYAQAYGLDKIFTDPMDLLRLSTKEGQKEYEEKKKLRDQYADLLKITPRAQTAWTNLELMMQAAGAQMQSVFGEKLADLAKPLAHLSDGFVHLIRALMDSPAVQKLIKQLAEWIDELATKMKELTEDDIQKFIDKVRAWLPSMDQFKSAMKDFVDILQSANSVLHWIKGWADYLGVSNTSMAGAAQATGAGAINRGLSKVFPSDQAIIGGVKNFFGGGGSTASAAAPTASSPAPMSPGGGGAFRDFGGWGGGLGGADPNKMLQLPSSTTGMGWLNTLPGATPSIGTWSGAANRMAPPSGPGSTVPKDQTFQDRWNQRGMGPLSSNNWQMNRTANLVIRNVPGSNVFMSAAGMVG